MKLLVQLSTKANDKGERLTLQRKGREKKRYKIILVEGC